MIWDDKGFLISKNKYNENSLIAEIFTEKYGNISGIIFGATSKKIKNYLNYIHLPAPTIMVSPNIQDPEDANSSPTHFFHIRMYFLKIYQFGILWFWLLDSHSLEFMPTSCCPSRGIAATCMGWERDPVTKRLFANPKKWPRGYKALIDYLHARKLKIAACQHQPPLHLTYCCPLSAASHRRSRAAAGRLGYRGDELLRQRRDEQRQAGAGDPWVRGAGHPAVRGVG